LKPIFGWLISLVTLGAGTIIPAQTNVEAFVLAPPLAAVAMVAERTEVTPKTVLLAEYSFNETSTRVERLQQVIGTVRVDGNYGAITRREHLEKLQALNLPTDNVPPTVAPKVSGDVGYDIPSDLSKRCPQWIPLFKEHGLEPVEVFSYIAWRESGCRPEAQNAKWDANGNMTYYLNKDKSYDTGLLQINSSWFSVTKLVCGKDSVNGRMAGLKDPVCNVMVAKYIMDNSEGKLGNWRVYKN
jgi:hypothetical protein